MQMEDGYNIMIFTYDLYRLFLRHIKKRYTILKLRDWKKGPGVILRHDVDLSIASAYNLALLENKLGVSSTYFIMITNNFYNPLAPINRKQLKRMSQLGFEIGIHFDPTTYGKISDEELHKKLESEVKVLEMIIDEPVHSVSIHNPSVHKKYILFKTYNNAYDPHIFHSGIYLADSQMTFQTDIYQFCNMAKTATLQLLLHPEHFSVRGDNYLVILSKIIIDFTDKLEEVMKVNNSFVQLTKEQGMNLKDYFIEKMR